MLGPVSPSDLTMWSKSLCVILKCGYFKWSLPSQLYLHWKGTNTVPKKFIRYQRAGINAILNFFRGLNIQVKGLGFQLYQLNCSGGNKDKRNSSKFWELLAHFLAPSSSRRNCTTQNTLWTACCTFWVIFWFYKCRCYMLISQLYLWMRLC